MTPGRRIAAACAALFGILAAGPAPAQKTSAPAQKTVAAYAVSAIPDSLVAGADAVVRLNHMRLSVDSPSAATLRVEEAFTIFAPQADYLAEEAVFYDSFSDVQAAEGWLLDSAGNVRRSLGAGDISDVSAIQGFSLYEDSRVKLLSLVGEAYPYTVVFKYTLQMKGLLDLPDWYPLPLRGAGEVITLERADCDVDFPAGLAIRYHELGLPAADSAAGGGVQRHALEVRGKRHTLHWALRNLRSPRLEPYGPPALEKSPRVLLAPVEFELDGAAGRMSSWAEFGRWFYPFYEDALALPESERQRLVRLCDDAPRAADKVARLYGLLQSSTRYVSVQLGIGGWKPFPATDVAAKKYGDCKALTTYMAAMLKAVGIPALPALVYAGAGAPDIVSAFPSNQFNHVILCVPLGPDTTWLECTSNVTAPGFLGRFTEDRAVLLVTPDGGRITRTPRSTSAQNGQVCRGRIELSSKGIGTASIRLGLTGDRADEARMGLGGGAPRDCENWLRHSIRLLNYQILSYDIPPARKTGASLDLAYRLSVPGLATVAGDRLVIPLNAMNRNTLVPPPDTHRTDPVRLDYAFVDIDTVDCTLPAGYLPKSLPPAVQLDSEFGSYHAESSVSAGALRYVRRFEVRVAEVPPGSYDQFRDFMNRVARSDNVQAVLVRS